MGYLCANEAATAAVELRTQSDWRKFIEVIRRNTPLCWRYHSEFESAANECLAEAIRAFNPGKGIPFEGFLAHVARRRVLGILRRFARGEKWASTDEDGIRTHLDLRGDQHDDVAPRRQDAIAEIDSLDAVRRFAVMLSAAECATVLLLARGLKPAEVARHRNVTRSSVSNAIARIQPKAGRLRAT